MSTRNQAQPQPHSRNLLLHLSLCRHQLQSLLQRHRSQQDRRYIPSHCSSLLKQPWLLSNHSGTLQPQITSLLLWWSSLWLLVSWYGVGLEERKGDVRLLTDHGCDHRQECK